LGWKKHKLELRLLGEISITSVGSDSKMKFNVGDGEASNGSPSSMTWIVWIRGLGKG